MENIEWPKISIVITSYFESAKPYLDLCMESIQNLSYPKDKLEILLVTKPGYAPQYNGVKTVYPEKEKFTNAEGINFGCSVASKDSKYYLICNDDIIATKGMLEPLVYQAQDDDCALMPILSCHNGWKFNLIIGYQDGQEYKTINKRFNKLNDWLPIKDKLMNTTSFYPGGILMYPTLCLVTFLVPVKTWNRIGGFDESFATCGQDDVDWSLRASRAGCLTGILLNSLCFHFGGSSTSTVTDETRAKNIEKFKAKHGFVPDGI